MQAQIEGLEAIHIPKLTKLMTSKPYNLNLEYDDGTSGVIDMSRMIQTHPLFASMQGNYDVFAHVRQDPYYGGIVRDDQRDLCPDACYFRLIGRNLFTNEVYSSCQL